MTVCLRGFVSGRVQGVGFRAFTRRTALAAGVTGWARNCPDGRVEVLLHGTEAAVDRVVAALHRGPPLAHVTTVELADHPPPETDGFHIS